jgi:glycosyltransferase involved in cell wall biosynthesis
VKALVPLRVGIAGPCAPPYGGIVRMLENHLRFWDRSEVEAHFVPIYPPGQPEPLQGAALHDLAASGEYSFKGLPSYTEFYARAPLTRPWVYRHLWQYNRALARLISERDLDVIYAHETWPAGSSAVLQSRINKQLAAVVVTYGETWHTTPEYRRQKRIEPYVLNGAHRLISTSEHCRAGALRRGSDLVKHEVVYAGIDLERFHLEVDGRGFRASRGIPEGAFVISSLGLSLRRKLDTLLDALHAMAVPKNAAELYCLIGGTGKDADYIRERLTAIKHVRVHQLGFVSEDDLPAFYAATDALVVSPSTLTECMGQSLKEAMACGRAVVGSDIGGIPEAIEDGRSGLLFKADDPRDLARTLEALVADRDACARYGAEARRVAEVRFDAAVSAQKTLRILQDAVHTAREGLTS